MSSVLSSFIIIWLLFFPQTRVDSLKVEGDDEFKLVKSEKDVILYERWTILQNGSPGREVKAEFVVKAGLENIFALIKDEERTKIWYKNLSDCKITDEGENKWMAYYQYAIPWPLSNQDCVLYHKVETLSRTNRKLVIHFKSFDDQRFPVLPGIKRIEEIYGKWEVEAKSEDEFQIRYFITTSPSSSMPKWITDPIIRGNLISTMSNFRQQAEQGY